MNVISKRASGLQTTSFLLIKGLKKKKKKQFPLIGGGGGGGGGGRGGCKTALEVTEFV